MNVTLQAKEEHDLNSLFRVFLDSVQGQSASSQRNYRHRLEMFLERYGNYTPSHVQRRHINRWHEWLKGRDLAALADVAPTDVWGVG
ncbi:MAG: hypothetical protein R3C43_09750 [Chloroflexota bacterium]